MNGNVGEERRRSILRRFQIEGSKISHRFATKTAVCQFPLSSSGRLPSQTFVNPSPSPVIAPQGPLIPFKLPLIPPRSRVVSLQTPVVLSSLPWYFPIAADPLNLSLFFSLSTNPHEAAADSSSLARHGSQSSDRSFPSNCHRQSGWGRSRSRLSHFVPRAKAVFADFGVYRVL
jgi:hypothetical protein